MKPCSKPSPSKRRCSDENKILGTENKQPKSPEIVKNTQPEIVAQPQVRPTEPTPPRTIVTSKEEPKVHSEDHGAPSVRSRMQRLADQRRYWDNDGNKSSVPPFFYFIFFSLLYIYFLLHLFYKIKAHKC